MFSPAYQHSAESGRVRDVDGGELDDVVEFLSRDVVSNIFMLSWLENYGVTAPGRPDLFHFRTLRLDDELVGVALVITERLLLLSTTDAEVARRLGSWHRDHGFRLEHVVSQRQCVAPFWASYSTAPDVRARLVRDQELYSLARADWLRVRPQRPATELSGTAQLARLDDVHAIFWASAAMHTEETLEDPLERDAEHFRRHVEHRIDHGRTYAWFDEHRRLLFKADISAQSPWGAQISGVYTPKALRGNGIATVAMHDICESLFGRGFSRVTLYVNRSNHAARRVYEKVGFRFHTDYQTIFVEAN